MNLAANAVDIAVIGVLLLSALVAFGLGFSRTVLYFAAWAVAVYAAWRFYPLGTPYAQKYLPDQFAEGAAAFVIFVGVLLVCWIIAHFITRGIRRSMFSMVDRLLGLGLGLVIGGVVLSAASYFVLDFLMPRDEDRPVWLREARALPYLERGSGYLQAVLPDALKRKTALAAGDLRRQIDGAVGAEHAAAGSSGSDESSSTQQQQGYSDSERRDIDHAVEGSGQGQGQGQGQGSGQ